MPHNLTNEDLAEIHADLLRINRTEKNGHNLTLTLLTVVLVALIGLLGYVWHTNDDRAEKLQTTQEKITDKMATTTTQLAVVAEAVKAIQNDHLQFKTRLYELERNNRAGHNSGP